MTLVPHRQHLPVYPALCLEDDCPLVAAIAENRDRIETLEARVAQLTAYAEAAATWLEAMKVGAPTLTTVGDDARPLPRTA